MVTGAGGGAGEGAAADVMNLPMPWGVLGLRPTADTQLVRRAYAALIRQYRPDSHPREFARVRQAYEQAQEQASYFSQYEDDGEAEAEDTDERETQTGDSAEKDQAEQLAPPDPVPVQLPADDAAPASSPGQPAVFIPLAQWDVATDPVTAPEPVNVTQPGDLPWPEAAAPSVLPAPQPVPVPLGAGDDEEQDEADAYITRPGLLPDWAAISSFDATEQVHALIRCWHVNGEVAALSLLRQQLVLASQATIDAGMDYQEQLLQWLLGSDAPPLGLVFEGERLLHWSEHGHDIRLRLGDIAEQRLLLLLQLAQDYVFCSRFSGNHWDRLLFAAPARRVPWLAFTTSIQATRQRLQQWREHCAQAGLSALLNQLNPAAVRCMDGAVVYSSDIFLGLLLVLIKSDAGAFSGDARGMHLLLAVLAVVFVAAACVGWRWLIRFPVSQWLWKRSERYRQDIVPSVLVIGVLSSLAFFGFIQDESSLAKVVAGGFLGLIGLCLFVAFLSGWWWLMLFLEALLLQVWYRPRDVIARLDFRHLLPSDIYGWIAPSWRQRLRLLPETLMQGWRNRAKKRSQQTRWLLWALGGLVLFTLFF